MVTTWTKERQREYMKEWLEASKVTGIYKITNIRNGKFYIGSAIHIKNRWRIHRDELKANKHGNKYLQRSYDKYGMNNFLFEIIETFEDASNLLIREQYYIDTLNPEYNILKVAGSRLGSKASDETKLKQSIARQSYVTSDETKAKISAAHTDRIMTDLHKERLSKAAKGIPKSKAHKEALKLAWAKRRKMQDDEFFKNMKVINANV